MAMVSLEKLSPALIDDLHPNTQTNLKGLLTQLVPRLTQLNTGDIQQTVD
jgi:hypothetical protein